MCRWRRASLLGITALAAACGWEANDAPSDAQSASSDVTIAPPTASESAAQSAAPSGAPSAAPSAPRDALSKERLLADAATLADPRWSGRGSGTPEESLAAGWLAGHLDELGIGLLGGQRVQPFKFDRRYPALKGAPSQNVLGVIAKRSDFMPTATTAWVVLGAHYDHLGERDGEVYLGAEDNASGTALVLGIARELVRRREELARPVLILFFGAEEAGLCGSRHFVKTFSSKRHGRFAAMVNLDMIGRPLVDDPTLWFGARLLGILRDVEPSTSVGVLLPKSPPPWLVPLVRDTAKPHGLTPVFPDDLPPSLREYVRSLGEGRSDHAPFEERGVPTVFFSSGESPDYHQPTDTVDRLDGAAMEQRARAALDLVVALSQRPD